VLTPRIFVMFAFSVPWPIPALTCQAGNNKAYSNEAPAAPGGRRGRQNQRPLFKRQAKLPSHLTREQQSDGWLVVRPARHRLRHMQEFVERDGAFHNGVTSATVHKELRVMVKDIDDEERLPRGTSRRGCVHTNIKVSDPCQRNRRRVTLGAGQQADICSGNFQRCKIVFQRTAYEKLAL